MNEPILEMKHLTMGFGGLELFSDINISVKKGRSSWNHRNEWIRKNNVI